MKDAKKFLMMQAVNQSEENETKGKQTKMIFSKQRNKKQIVYALTTFMSTMAAYCVYAIEMYERI